MMAAGSLAGLGCSRARTVLTYLDKERVKLGDSRVDGSWLLGWPTKLEVEKSEQRTSSSTYLGCSRARTVTLLPPGSQCCTPQKTSFLIQSLARLGTAVHPTLGMGEMRLEPRTRPITACRAPWGTRPRRVPSPTASRRGIGGSLCSSHLSHPSCAVHGPASCA